MSNDASADPRAAFARVVFAERNLTVIDDQDAPDVPAARPFREVAARAAAAPPPEARAAPPAPLVAAPIKSATPCRCDARAQLRPPFQCQSNSHTTCM